MTLVNIHYPRMDKGINDVEQSRYLSFPSDLIKWGYVVEEDRRVRQDWKGPKYTVEGVYRLVGILGALNCPNTGQFRYMAAYHRDPQNANKRLVQQRTYKSPTTKKDMPVSFASSMGKLPADRNYRELVPAILSVSMLRTEVRD